MRGTLTCLVPGQRLDTHPQETAQVRRSLMLSGGALMVVHADNQLLYCDYGQDHRHLNGYNHLLYHENLKLLL